MQIQLIRNVNIALRLNSLISEHYECPQSPFMWSMELCGVEYS